MGTELYKGQRLVTLDAWSPQPDFGDADELGRERGQLGYGLLLSLGLLGGRGAWATFHPHGAVEDRVFGVPVALVGGLFLWTTLAPPKGTTMGLRLDADGVHSKNLLNGYAFDLPWSEVAGVRVEIYESQGLMVLDAKDPLRDIGDTNELGRGMRRKRLAAVGSRLVVLASLFGLTPEALRDEIERFWRAQGGNLART